MIVELPENDEKPNNIQQIKKFTSNLFKTAYFEKCFRLKLQVASALGLVTVKTDQCSNPGCIEEAIGNVQLFKARDDSKRAIR